MHGYLHLRTPLSFFFEERSVSFFAGLRSPFLLRTLLLVRPILPGLLGRVLPAQEFSLTMESPAVPLSLSPFFGWTWSDFYVETPTVSLFTPSFNFLCLVVWLGFTTWCRRTFERNLRSLARCTSLHVRFTRFHQDLGWLSCLRSPTFRHAVDHFVIRVSPDISASFC